MKKFLSLLLSAALTLSLVATNAMASTGNVSFTVDKNEVVAGDVITVTVNSAEKTISTDGFNVEYDMSKVTATSIIDDAGYADSEALFMLTYNNGRKDVDREFSVAEINSAEGKVAFGFANTDDVTYYEKEGFAVIKFTVNADATGDIVFKLNENSAGASGYVGVVDTKTVTVKGEEPTATPTAEPTATPTAEPTATPTAEPTATPTAEPTATPTAEPADKVTVDETATAVADDTAYWGVKILEAAEANITAKFETDTESKEVTLVNAAGLDGNGDLAFNLYLKLTGERVGKAVTATVTVGDDSDSGVWAAAN